MIEFIESSHTYIVDGIVTPSVTQIIHAMNKDMYANIPKDTLRRAAQYGDKVHALIEYWNDNKDTPDDYERKSFEGIALRRYQQLQDRNNIVAASQEQPVAYYYEGKPLFAGKYDMIASVGGELSIIDIKTTSQYHSGYLSDQLSLYKLAIEQTTKEPIKNGYCLWLPKKALGNLINVQFNENILTRIVDVAKHLADQ